MFARFWLNAYTNKDIILIVFIGTILALMSPFGATSHLPIVGAWAYWTGLLTWGWMASRFIGPRLKNNLPKLSSFWFYLLASFIMAALVFPAVLLIQLATGHPVSIVHWPNLYFLIWVVSVAVSGVSFLSDRAFPDKPSDNGARFFARIPAKISDGSLYAVSSEDHYLRIYTAQGSDLILMRLADAISELGDYDGMQVHRSWWVAKEGVEQIKRDQGKLHIILRDQTKVPVSRTYAPKIRVAGWLS